MFLDIFCPEVTKREQKESWTVEMCDILRTSKCSELSTFLGNFAEKQLAKTVALFPTGYILSSL